MGLKQKVDLLHKILAGIAYHYPAADTSVGSYKHTDCTLVTWAGNMIHKTNLLK